MKCKQILAATIALATAITLAVPTFAMTVTDVKIIYVPSPEEMGQSEIPDGYSFEAQLEGDGLIFTPENGWDSGTSGSAINRKEDKPDTDSSSTSEPPSWTKKPAKEKEPVDITGYAEEVVRLVNLEREKAGLEPYLADPVLTEMAQKRALELREKYSHTRPNGKQCDSIFEEYETELKYRGENIALHSTPEKVVQAWMDSEGHRANILRKDARYMGVGVTTGGRDGYLCWVQEFAK